MPTMQVRTRMYITRASCAVSAGLGNVLGYLQDPHRCDHGFKWIRSAAVVSLAIHQ